MMCLSALCLPEQGLVLPPPPPPLLDEHSTFVTLLGGLPAAFLKMPPPRKELKSWKRDVFPCFCPGVGVGGGFGGGALEREGKMLRGFFLPQERGCPPAPSAGAGTGFWCNVPAALRV